MACSASELLAEGACYSCMGEKQMMIAELALLCQIIETFSGGGGGGGVQFAIRGSGSPEGVQQGGSVILYYDIVGNSFWAFRGTSGSSTGWEELIA